MKSLAVALYLLLIMLLPAHAQMSGEKLVQNLHNFETDWLAADLNADQKWQRRFSDDRLSIITNDKSLIGKRATAVLGLLDVGLAANEMKVRITGTIGLLTNDAARNRTFQFIDTFNKKDGKWVMIATGITPMSEPLAGLPMRSVEATLTDLENSLARSVAGNDRSKLDAMIAPGFVGTSIDGRVNDRSTWISGHAAQKSIIAKVDEVAVHLVSDTVAVVTGISAKTDAKGNESAGRERFIHTWISRDGQWQMVVAQATAIP